MPARDDNRRQQVKEMRGKGMSYAAIGKALEPPVTQQAVLCMMKRMGIHGRVKLACDGRSERWRIKREKALDKVNDQA